MKEQIAKFDGLSMVNEAAQAEEMAQDAKFLELKKKVAADQALWAKYVSDMKADERSRHIAVVFHERNQREQGKLIANRVMERMCKIVCSNDRLGIVSLANVATTSGLGEHVDVSAVMC